MHERRNQFLQVLVLVGLAFSSLGCQPKYGRAVSIRLESEPAGASAYLIPSTEWRAHGMENVLASETALKRYFRGITPTDVFAGEMKSVYVLRKKEWEDLWQEIPIRFKEGQVFTGRMAPKADQSGN
jgi:hypothetical protein